MTNQFAFLRKYCAKMGQSIMFTRINHCLVWELYETYIMLCVQNAEIFNIN